MRYGVQIDLRYLASPSDDPATEVERIVSQLIDLEDSTAGLLDSTVGLDLNEATIEVEMTVEDHSAGAALDAAVALLQTAIHAAGGHTLGWEGDSERLGRIAFTIDDEEGLNVRRLELVGA